LDRIRPLFRGAETSPRLRITSPEKRCGKSRLLDLLNVLCPRPLGASNISPSAIFRVIELEHCTLLIDEADSFLRDNEDMRNLINSGHTPEFAFVIRSVPIGDKAWEPKRFSTWCPMVIAGIGRLADTVEDRSIKIAMRRKLRGDKVDRLTRRNKGVREEATALASKLARFAADSLEKLSAQPRIPDALKRPRGLSSVIDAGDRLIDITAEYSTIEKSDNRRTRQRFWRADA